MRPSSDYRASGPKLAELGMETIVYIRPVTVNGRRVHIIHAADGTPLTVVSNRDLAFAAAAQFNMDPQSLH